ncbi:sigma-70 family RNA polymerase sigma factor [Streptomyces sp. NPDC056169]|uniref:sigma-70 family RNA polymerase sigma factor n=1 Tax=Streptomyces sp. NPDC056169 TaxID=3345734 RepID=UPI0035D6D205
MRPGKAPNPACSNDSGSESSARSPSQGAALSRSTATEPAYELIDDLESLGSLIARLDRRDREILALRFAQELTRAETGRRIGLSQMHVSRLLARILSELRAGLLHDETKGTDRRQDRDG